MKRSYLIFFISIFLVMAYGMTGTGAWFTDQVMIEDAAVTTGNLDLVLSDITKFTPALEPGGDYKEALRFCAKNNGTYTMKFRGVLANIVAPSGMAEKILVKAVMNPVGLAGNYGPANTPRFENVPVAELMAANTHILLDSTVAEPFKKDDFICYSIQAKLSSAAGNAYQSKTFSANLILDATQWINPGWSE